MTWFYIVLATIGLVIVLPLAGVALMLAVYWWQVARSRPWI